MKKILQVVGAIGRGGDTVAIANMAKLLDCQKFQMDFLSHECYADHAFVDRYRAQGGQVFLLPGDVRKMGALSYFCEIYKLLKQQKYDIVHVHTSFQSSIILIAAFLAGVRSRICHSHTTMTQRPMSRLAKLFYLPVCRLLIKCFATRRVACGMDAGNFLFGNSTYEVLHNGIDTTIFRPIDQKNDTSPLEKYDVHGKILIGQVGSIKPMKNQEFTIHLCDKITQPYEMFFVGTGIQKDILEAKSSKNPHIHFLGVRSDIASLMQIFDVLLLPSLPGEGLPVTAIEAQSCGCTCIMSEHITREADLGIGLAHFVSLKDCNGWLAHLKKRKMLNPKVIADAINQCGFNVEDAAIKWIGIYEN